MARPLRVVRNKSDGTLKLMSHVELSKNLEFEMIRVATPEEIKNGEVNFKPSTIDVPSTKFVDTSQQSKPDSIPEPLIEVQSADLGIEVQSVDIEVQSVDAVDEVKHVAKQIVKPVKKKRNTIPKNLVCDECGARANSKESYKKNHGSRCFRKVKSSK